MQLKDLMNIIEFFAPLETAEDYDNSGLIYGDKNTYINNILLTIDLTPKVALEAAEKNCNLIIEHHPSIFNPIKKLDLSSPSIKAIDICIKKNIAVYCAHTNIDFAKDGLNDLFAKKIGIVDLVENKGNNSSPRIGYLEFPHNLGEYLDYIKDSLDDNNVLCVGNLNKLIKKVACVNGAGATENNIIFAINSGADVFVSSEFKHHLLRFAKDMDYAIISVSHFKSEKMFYGLIKRLILNVYPKANVLQAISCDDPLE